MKYKQTALALSFLVLSSFGTFASQGLAQSALEAAKRFRSEVEVTPQEQQFFTAATDESVDVPMGEVFDQRGTLWCWGYSAYNTFRSYYQNMPSDGSDFDAWHAAVNELDDPQRFKAFMGQYYAHGRTGEPAIFVAKFEEAKRLTPHTWTVYLPSGSLDVDLSDDDTIDAPETLLADVPVVRLSRRDVARQIRAGLEQGAPSAYCAGVHCVTIYGGTYQGETALTYLVADTLSGKYSASAGRMDARLKQIMTLGR